MQKMIARAGGAATAGTSTVALYLSRPSSSQKLPVHGSFLALAEP
jgi:hypothetical protein